MQGEVQENAFKGLLGACCLVRSRLGGPDMENGVHGNPGSLKTLQIAQDLKIFFVITYGKKEFN